jgi:hypothetical protein
VSAGVSGEYEGRPSSPDSVKKTIRYGGLTVKIDRPKGFVMHGLGSDGKPWTRRYQHDYGFIPKTDGGDGDGIDVFIGPVPDDEEAYWVRQLKDDGSLDEFKVFVGFGSRQAAERAFKAHIPSKYFGGIATMKIGMMKAMLGLQPEERVAMRLGLFDELARLERPALGAGRLEAKRL